MQREPPAERLKAFFLTRLNPPMAGQPLGVWLRFMLSHPVDVDPVFWPKLALNAICSSFTSMMKRQEERTFRNEPAVKVPPPLFVLGHYRSGTTHLHNLLAVDQRFTFPTMFRIYNPYTFRVFEPKSMPLVRRLVPRRRIVDNMAWGPDLPQEDELALLMLTGMSPYLGFVFSRQAEHFERYLNFRDVPLDDVRRWQDGLQWFLRKLTRADGRPLLLKSPPHTARIRLILERFPDARFVHIHREPYAVYRSSVQLFERVTEMVGLQRPARNKIPGRVLRQYRQMYDAYFTDRALVPRRQLHEIRFEDLERDPLSEVERTYTALKLGDFAPVRPALSDYVASLQGYRKNQYPPLAERERRAVAEAWRQNFDEWGYDISAA